LRDLTVLGALMTGGYLVERFDRAHLRHWDPVETPLVVASLGLAALNDPRTAQADPGAYGEGQDLASTEDDPAATGEEELDSGPK
jgi:hypothetical protein